MPSWALAWKRFFSMMDLNFRSALQMTMRNRVKQVRDAVWQQKVDNLQKKSRALGLGDLCHKGTPNNNKKGYSGRRADKNVQWFKGKLVHEPPKPANPFGIMAHLEQG